MSPSWRNRFEIALCLDEVAVRRWSAGLRAKEDLVIERAPVDELSDRLGDILDRLTGNNKYRPPATANIVLSESFVRHTLVPWSPLVRGKAERAALLRACFEDTYGEPSLTWRLIADRGEYALPAPACGVEHSLLTGIAAVLASRQIRLRSATPFFSAVFNHHRPRLSSGPVVLAVGDSEWTTLATFVDGRWNSLRSVRLTGDPAALPSALSREATLQGLPRDALKLLCTPADDSKSANVGDIEVLRPWKTLSKPHRSVALLNGCWPR